MFGFSLDSIRSGKFAGVFLLVFALASPHAVYGDQKKKKDDAATPKAAVGRPVYDFSKLVWPSPPDIARVRYVDYFTGMKIDYSVADKKKQKQGWMDRLAGTPEGQEKADKLLKDYPWQLVGPYGVGVDSNGLVYVADQKVGAIFIFNTETKDVQLIRNGAEAHLSFINGIALDDNDRLFVSDGKLRHVLVFNAKHEVEATINEGMVDPNGLAVDSENRLLYVVDTQQDQVLVYDADTFKLLRRIGSVGPKHTLTTPGDFAAPTNVALDADQNVYVTDTLNDRVEIFDADGNFISTFGKNCDGPGCFQRPKGIAIDSDGHIWVGDPMSDRLQVFNREGQLLTYIGGHGTKPSLFSSMAGVGIDKKRNRVFTTEVYPGRLQEFRYITDEEAAVEKKRQEDERQKKADAIKAARSTGSPAPATEATPKVVNAPQSGSTPAQATAPNSAVK